MTKVMRLLRNAQPSVAPLKTDPAPSGRKQSRNQTKQRRLAGTVRTGYRHHVASPHRKAHLLKDLAAAAHAGEVARQQPALRPGVLPATDRAEHVKWVFSQLILLTSADFLEPATKTPYKPALRGRRAMMARILVILYRRQPALRAEFGMDQDDVTRQFQVLQIP